MQSQNEKVVIGRAELVGMPGVSKLRLPARVDTGANTSAIWASQVIESERGLEVVFFGPKSKYYTGEVQIFNDFEQVVVSSSFGHEQIRYRVRIVLRIAGKRIRARFTLADRSTQVYPVLIGRNVLRGKFVVDVRHGTPLRHAEKARSEALQSKLRKGED